MGVRRKGKRFGINHCTCVDNHQLYMLHVASTEDLFEELTLGEEPVPMGDEPVQHEEARIVLKRRRPQYFDKRQQLNLVLAAQELSEFGDHELSPTELNNEEDHGVKLSCVDIWEDIDCFMLLQEGVLPDAVDFEESKRIRKRASKYCWKEQKFFFKALLVPKPEERVFLVRRMHEDLGHFGEQRTLAEVQRRYF
jgi:hypothetical protein